MSANHSIPNMSSEGCCDIPTSDIETNKQLKIALWLVFGINLSMFFVEFYFGLQSRSSSLMADSLDMLADAFVYGLSLIVISASHIKQAKASLYKGMLMLALGLFVLGENIYKIIFPVLPTGQTISTIGFLALIANIICVVLLLKFRDKTLNVKSAWICSRNDAFGNVVVIAAGWLVTVFSSQWPDIIIGFILAFVVIKSSMGIMKVSRTEIKSHNRTQLTES